VPDVVGLERIVGESEVAAAGLEPKAEFHFGAHEQVSPVRPDAVERRN
jgi:hypothetical protein